jgi:hypothetical protein
MGHRGHGGEDAVILDEGRGGDLVATAHELADAAREATLLHFRSPA